MNKIANYIFSEKIGQGSFGTVFKGENAKTGEPVVIKTEKIGVEFSSLKHESSILNILYSKNCRNIPPTYWYGTTTVEPICRVLVMPFYEESLEMRSGFQFSNIMRSAISILSHIHDKYVVHRDIKPANFMIHNDELMLIDFGLASFYVDSAERHILPANPKKHDIIGTPKYASLNIHHGEEYSRRDDLMSVLYIGLFLLYGHDLWSHYDDTESCGLNKTELMHPRNRWFESQKNINNIRSLSSIWRELSIFAECIYGLSFQERPSYGDYIKLFN